jgi:hypothetical protein
MQKNYKLETLKQYLSEIGKWDDFLDFSNKKELSSLPNNITLVTGLWDLGRSTLDGWSHREFSTYKENFFKLLKIDIPMCIWIPSELEQEIWNIRTPENTKIYIKEVEDFKTWFPFFEQVNNIRTNPDWYNISGWLPESPQAALPMYNPMMMTKMFMVNDSAIMNPFDSKYFYWIDGGLTSTVPFDYFADTSVFENISKSYSNHIIHVAYPYEPHNEIHGYEKNKFYNRCEISSGEKNIYISRGGFFGGPKDKIHKYNEIYYKILEETIMSEEMGADECLFTIAAYKYPNLIKRFLIEGNGLVYPFFEYFKEHDNVELFSHEIQPLGKANNLYILTFNSPEQFKSVVESIQSIDPTMYKLSRKILVNNSIDENTFEEYDRLCEEHEFEEIHLNNLGVCGGRQFIAEHFDQTDADFYMFFEDDMHLADPKKVGNTCKNGFTTYIDNLYNKVIDIMLKEKFDFLKFSFTEFYGNNNIQWAWYNVPQSKRTEFWPHYDKLPEMGLDPEAPRTNFTNIEIADGLSYIKGEIYYSNWPQIVSREGNKKMFLDTTWAHPYEQTWMSHMYQLIHENKLTAGLLLASPIHHDRFDFYDGTLRKES